MYEPIEEFDVRGGTLQWYGDDNWRCTPIGFDEFQSTRRGGWIRKVFYTLEKFEGVDCGAPGTGQVFYKEVGRFKTEEDLILEMLNLCQKAFDREQRLIERDRRRELRLPLECKDL